MPLSPLLAAVDLGSNSFRLEIGRLDHGRIQRVDYLKETVRQGNGLDERNHLSQEAMQRGWDCLARFGERLAGFGVRQVRAVATQTLREARNREEFLARGGELLGFPIEVIPGGEEARLIYQGVAHLLPDSDERRLVVDIGGRSTELILGQRHASRVAQSFRVGSVAWSMQYFPQGRFTAAAFSAAEIAAQAVLEVALDTYPRDAWDVAYGSSGTVGAVGEALAAAGQAPGTITLKALDGLRDRLVRAGSAQALRIEGLKEDRRAVIGGGLSVLRAVMLQFGIEQMQVAQGALRQGVLYDLVDRAAPDTDLRGPSAAQLATRFGVDMAQADRVERTALHFFEQILPPDAAAADPEAGPARELRWAARLHEVGRRIAHSGYHKHGAYILDNADAAGFTLTELHRLSLLVLGQRGKLRKLEAHLGDAGLARQTLCLRLAVALCHARRDPDIASIGLRERNRTWTLRLPADWSRRFPQSDHLLREEALAWSRTGWTLELQQKSSASRDDRAPTLAG
ncbi:MAG: Ppx/GppA phosphatase family protein [Xylophilus ampelinus]